MIQDDEFFLKAAGLFQRRLDENYFRSRIVGGRYFIIKEKQQPFGYNEYAFFILSFSGLIYFTLIDFQSFIASLFLILLLFAITVFVIYPRRVKNQTFKYDFKSKTIHFRNGLSKKIMTETIYPNINIYCQIDTYLGRKDKFQPDSYSSTLFIKDENGKSSIIIQYNHKNNKNKVENFSRAIVEFLKSTSGLKNIDIIEN
jgi:hypothetical protein